MKAIQRYEEVRKETARKKMNKPKILIPMHSQWCEKIFNGEKRIDVRKTAPKIDAPFEALVYCTKSGGYSYRVRLDENRLAIPEVWNGKVIGSFICDKVDEYTFSNYEAQYRINDIDLVKTCLNHSELRSYGKGKTLRGLHITEPKLFDRPRELSEFGTICKKHGDDRCNDCLYLRVCAYDDCVDTWCGVGNIKPLTRAPQSWCYVREV